MYFALQFFCVHFLSSLFFCLVFVLMFVVHIHQFLPIVLWCKIVISTRSVDQRLWHQNTCRTFIHQTILEDCLLLLHLFKFSFSYYFCFIVRLCSKDCSANLIFQTYFSECMLTFHRALMAYLWEQYTVTQTVTKCHTFSLPRWIWFLTIYILSAHIGISFFWVRFIILLTVTQHGDPKKSLPFRTFQSCANFFRSSKETPFWMLGEHSLSFLNNAQDQRKEGKYVSQYCNIDTHSFAE